ncbi:M20/M25/M40 family metallo-hydrolase [Streptomyces sp. NPDC090301]|uniref:M20/M25/M40 family metallo-hydrolase n=1 Tax=Streptomyces sp. NPDC090301 TaxID=3154975 RepID=UPI003443A0E3
MDTVFDDGTAADRPFHMNGTTAYGPGVSDDKGGLLAGLTALEILHEASVEDFGELVFLATPDEEIGSQVSRPVIERTARGMHCGVGLECARENGDLVFARKGVADFRLTVTGRAAHAGIEPERGANAALAAAHLTVELQGLNGLWDDVTVNVGVVRAGTRPNIVCAEAELHIEVRAATSADMRRATEAIHRAAAHPAVPGTAVVVAQIDLCPPMEDTPPRGASSKRLARPPPATGCGWARRPPAQSATPTSSPVRECPRSTAWALWEGPTTPPATSAVNTRSQVPSMAHVRSRS